MIRAPLLAAVAFAAAAAAPQPARHHREERRHTPFYSALHAGPVKAEPLPGNENPGAPGLQPPNPAALALSSANPAAKAQPAPAPAASAQAGLSAADRAFLQRSASDFGYEQQLVDLATYRANNPQLRFYAEAVMQAHADHAEELQHLAQHFTLTLASVPDAAQQSRLERLRALRGDQFDAEFISQARAINGTEVQSGLREEYTTGSREIESFLNHSTPADQRLEEAVANLSIYGASPGSGNG